MVLNFWGENFPGKFSDLGKLAQPCRCLITAAKIISDPQKGKFINIRRLSVISYLKFYIYYWLVGVP